MKTIQHDLNTLNTLTYMALRAFWWLYFRPYFKEFSIVSYSDPDKAIRLKPPITLPQKGAFLIANHPNSLLDALTLAMCTRRPLRFVAIHTLWKYAVLRPFLAAGAAIPIYRKEDQEKYGKLKQYGATQNIHNNYHSKVAIAKAASSDLICIFPEGTTHMDPKIKPIKRGILRFMSEAQALVEGENSSIGYQVVGLYYQHRTRFRCRCLVIIGQFKNYKQFLDQVGTSEQEQLNQISRDLISVLPQTNSLQDKNLLRNISLFIVAGDYSIEDLWKTELKIAQYLSAVSDTTKKTIDDYLMKLGSNNLTITEIKKCILQFHSNRSFISFAIQFASLILVTILGTMGLFFWGIPYYVSASLGSKLAPTTEEIGTYKMLGLMLFSLVYSAGVFFCLYFWGLFGSLAIYSSFVFFFLLSLGSFYGFAYCYDNIKQKWLNIKLYLLRTEKNKISLLMKDFFKIRELLIAELKFHK